MTLSREVDEYLKDRWTDSGCIFEGVGWASSKGDPFPFRLETHQAESDIAVAIGLTQDDIDLFVGGLRNGTRCCICGDTENISDAVCGDCLIVGDES
jgi:hypothetical protein